MSLIQIEEVGYQLFSIFLLVLRQPMLVNVIGEVEIKPNFVLQGLVQLKLLEILLIVADFYFLLFNNFSDDLLTSKVSLSKIRG